MISLLLHRVVWDRVHCPNQPELDQGGDDEVALKDSTTNLHQQPPSQQHAGGGAAPVSLAVSEPQASTSQVQHDSDKQKVPAGLAENKEESADTAPHRQVHR